MSTSLGLDTSNYTTSAACFEGQNGINMGRLLDVRAGELGLRQSDALFQHIKRLPGQIADLKEAGVLKNISAVAASTRPRAVDGSYMPCFLAGESLGRAIADILSVPFYAVSHQQGHLAAAAWSADHMELLDSPFLAWHLSGGTTELLYVEPEGASLHAVRIGGTTDLSAGQLIDRTGLLLGLDFPAGRALDTLAAQAEKKFAYQVKLNQFSFSLSGMENKIKMFVQQGELPETVAGFALNVIINTVCRVTAAAKREYTGLPVLFSGGVASNSQLRAAFASDAIFAKPQFSTDNAMGVAILAYRLNGVRPE